MKRKICFLIAGFFFSSITTGCSSPAKQNTKILPEAAASAPSWTTTGKDMKYPDSFYMTGTGVSSHSLKEADDFARQELVKQIEVHVMGVDEIISSEIRELEGDNAKIKTRSKILSAIKIEVNLLLKGIGIGERWYFPGKGEHYSLAVLERDGAVKRLDMKMKESEVAASLSFSRAKESEAKGEYFEALKNYLNSYSLLKAIGPDSLMRTVIAGDFNDDSASFKEKVSPAETVAQIERLLSGIRLRKISGDNQRGRNNYPLKSPLVAEIIYETPGGPAPLKDVPVLFAFKKGKGELSKENYSDSSGIVKTKISNVQSNENGQNTILLSLAGEKILSPLSVEAPRILTALNEKSVSFSYTLPSSFSQVQNVALSRDSAVRELVSALINGIKNLADIPVLKLAVFDFEEIVSQNRLKFSNSLESELKTNLALLRNVTVRVIDRKNDEIALTPVEKARGVNVPYVITGGYKLVNEGVKVSAKLIEVKSEVLISAAEILLKREDVTQTEFIIDGTPSDNKEYLAAVNTVLDLKHHESPFTVKIWTDKKEYNIGDKVVFFFKADQDCYLSLINIGTSGKITYLFPNQFHQDTFIKGGRNYSIPGPGYGFNIDISGPPGLERIKAVASAQPLPLNRVDISNGFFSIKPENTRRTRDLSVSIKDLPPTGWTEATYEFHVKTPKGIRFRGLKKQPIPRPEKPIDIMGTQGYSK